VLEERLLNVRLGPYTGLLESYMRVQSFVGRIVFGFGEQPCTFIEVY
jgi:hypothetical protein